MRNLLAVARHDHRQVIAALIRTIFAQPDRDTALTQLRAVVDQLTPIAAPGGRTAPEDGNRPARLHRVPARTLVQDLVQQPDRAAQPGTQTPHRRRADLPQPESVIRLVGALLVEINDEMIAAERRYIAAASLTPLHQKGNELASLPAAPRT
jgi:putative transposase